MSDLKEEIRKAVVAERERIALWHEAQAAALEAAVASILAEGSEIEVSHKSLAQLHRTSAAAIRAGAQ